jgi:hypothetical protein
MLACWMITATAVFVKCRTRLASDHRTHTDGRIRHDTVAGSTNGDALGKSEEVIADSRKGFPAAVAILLVLQ